ncbi:glycine-rich RNA-binding protein 3, mitochondrial isoform X3 [Beta vulgaris subsp. vulgaris]|uniref:glycine-rich RNA-binding protein 3, mitochondrial isoform X3 n=1 Tax=Beta vulgaris subsp. vulgaris TaxID=3555 RepID=UPI002036DDB9|nr:glycine-rich RNA-binding protein 3, mitochondrial isoform X3 [Beta vulgaris subsp. vulgaris]
MAFINKIGRILKETSRKLPRFESSFPNASFYQAIRCFSSSKLFIGARVIFDRESGRSRGFGFVSYASAEEASAAIQALDGRDLHGRFLKVDYAADQRRTSQGPSFSGAAGYGDSFRGNDGYGTISNQSGISGNGGNYNSYGNTGYGNTGNYSNSNYSSASAGNYEGSSANINGRATYTAEGVPSIHPGGNFSMRDVSNGASGHYLPNDVRDDFKGNPEGGYGVAAAFGGSSGNGSPEFTGNFSSNGYSNGNVDSYNANYGGANSFNNRAQYNTVREDNDYWRGHNLNSDNKLNDQDETTRSYMNDNGYTNARFG